VIEMKNQKNKPYIWEDYSVILTKEAKGEGLLTKIWRWIK
jgi:hypothetical protein